GKPEARIAGEVPAFVRLDMSFVDLSTSEKAEVRIDEEQGMARRAPRRTDHPAIRADVARQSPRESRFPRHGLAEASAQRRERGLKCRAAHSVVAREALLVVVVPDEGERVP